MTLYILLLLLSKTTKQKKIINNSYLINVILLCLDKDRLDIHVIISNRLFAEILLKIY